MSTHDKITITLFLWGFAVGLFNPFFQDKRLMKIAITLMVMASISWVTP